MLDNNQAEQNVTTSGRDAWVSDTLENCLSGLQCWVSDSPADTSFFALRDTGNASTPLKPHKHVTFYKQSLNRNLNMIVDSCIRYYSLLMGVGAFEPMFPAADLDLVAMGSKIIKMRIEHDLFGNQRLFCTMQVGESEIEYIVCKLTYDPLYTDNASMHSEICSLTNRVGGEGVPVEVSHSMEHLLQLQHCS